MHSYEFALLNAIPHLKLKKTHLITGSQRIFLLKFTNFIKKNVFGTSHVFGQKTNPPTFLKKNLIKTFWSIKYFWLVMIELKWQFSLNECHNDKTNLSRIIMSLQRKHFSVLVLFKLLSMKNRQRNFSASGHGESITRVCLAHRIIINTESGE